MLKEKLQNLRDEGQNEDGHTNYDEIKACFFHFTLQIWAKKYNQSYMQRRKTQDEDTMTFQLTVTFPSLSKSKVS